MKMDKAKELLLTENITVVTLCERIGYNNVSYFIRKFKEYTGFTPAKYREHYYMDNRDCEKKE